MKIFVMVVLGLGCGSVSEDTAGDASPAVTHVLTVEKTGAGEGTVSSASGIACGTDCSEAIAEGTSVSLTAEGDAASTFVEWTGSCTGSGACDVVITAATTVTARFAQAANLSFPSNGDNRSSSNAGVFNMDGDYVSGSRTSTGLERATHAKIHLVLENNSLIGAACTGPQKTQDISVLIGSLGAGSSTLGVVPISAGQTVVDAELSFAPVTGTSFSISYSTYTSVSAGCGGAGYTNIGSTLVLSDR